MGLSVRKMKFVTGILLFSAMLLLVVTVLSPFATAQALAGDKSNEATSQFEEELAFIFEEASTLKDGLFVLDTEKIEQRFGKDQVEGIALLVEFINSTAPGSMSTFSFGSCMLDALKDYLGISVVEAALSGGLYAYLVKKAWKDAAKLLVRYAITMNVAGLTATLIFYSGKCAIWGYKADGEIAYG
ncbi:hypothetical protein LQV63_13360 [Paenibacillus profundus]|uniref:Uncharacterized protein n=1 Tax=Paenibacillus profundus TaxID=1173085 RepID=A0ABS8YE70_9BACL|nr:MULTISPECIES: hypothetical protein [Paenibacillus]MCE5170298.1 hypothetical protein [Paenibacillus profundus]